jgi:hypothetical protein
MSSIPALGFTPTPEALSPGVKWPECEAEHSFPTSAEIKKNVDLYIHSPICLHGVVLNYLSTWTTLPLLFKYCQITREYKAHCFPEMTQFNKEDANID